MNLKEIKSIRALVAEAKLEEALQGTVVLLEKNTAQEELLKAAQINQADFFQTKANLLKGTLSNEDVRLANNQVTDKLLEILKQLESGISLDKKEETDKVSPWRYYVAGGVVTLALALFAWNYVLGNGKIKDCPTFGDKAQFKVMVLPFLAKTGTEGQHPEYDIMLSLNNLAAKSQLEAETDVQESFDIKANYPSPSVAEDLAKECGTNMIVWGLVGKTIEEKLQLDVQYRLVDENGEAQGEDQSLNSLFAASPDGRWQEDTDAISRLLFAVIGNAMDEPQIALATLDEYAKSMKETRPVGEPAKGPASTTGSGTYNSHSTNTTSNAPDVVQIDLSEIDTTLSFTKAQSYLIEEDFEKAILEYDKIILVNPTSQKALRNRGLAHYNTAIDENKRTNTQQHFEAAARDLEAAMLNPSKEDMPVMRVQTESYIKTNQLKKAEKTLEKMKKMDKSASKPTAWYDKIDRELSELRLLAITERDAAEKAARRSRSSSKQLKAAQLNLDLGENEKAATVADKVLVNDPKNYKAMEIKLETQLAMGDTLAARKTIEKAVKSGLNAKTVIQRMPRIAPLILPRRNKN